MIHTCTCISILVCYTSSLVDRRAAIFLLGTPRHVHLYNVHVDVYTMYLPYLEVVVGDFDGEFLRATDSLLHLASSQRYHSL